MPLRIEEEADDRRPCHAPVFRGIAGCHLLWCPCADLRRPLGRGHRDARILDMFLHSLAALSFSSGQHQRRRSISGAQGRNSGVRRRRISRIKNRSGSLSRRSGFRHLAEMKEPTQKVPEPTTMVVTPATVVAHLTSRSPLAKFIQRAETSPARNSRLLLLRGRSAGSKVAHIR